MNNPQNKRKAKRKAIKERAIENIEMMGEYQENKTEVMCAYLRASDALARLFVDIQREERTAAETALLWIVYEQCVHNGKAYAKLLVHGTEAFAALGIEDGCPVEQIENRLFEK